MARRISGVGLVKVSLRSSMILTSLVSHEPRRLGDDDRAGAEHRRG
jgi:hypothetical protein